MQKKLAILLAFFIVFAPIYSNAVLPALAATVASNGGRVLIGQTIKKVAPSAIANARKALVGICQKNPNYCRGAGAALGLKLISDGWNIDVTNNDTTNNIDVDIYKLAKTGQCQIEYGFVELAVTNKYSGETVRSASAYYDYFLSNQRKLYPSYVFSPFPNWQNSFDAAAVSILAITPVASDWRVWSNVPFNYYRGSSALNNSVTSVYRCVIPPQSRIYITKSELNQYITNNNINDIDILDIYNFDFSQYNNITIGGDTYNGTTINNDLAKSDPSEADKKVSADLKKKLDSKELSLDDVTDENCTKNEAGEYDKCGADKEPDPDNPDPEEPEPEPENPTCELEENLFRKKICEWIDWTQTKHDKPESGNVTIIDKSDDLDINEDRITFDDQCPPPTPIELVVMGFPYSEELNYQPFCDFFGMLNPFVVGMGGISSALIIAGGIRRG